VLPHYLIWPNNSASLYYFLNKHPINTTNAKW
jgi:hypothetical protein